MDTGRTILTKGLPKTGQEDVYSGYDDGVFEVGWWRGRTIQFNKIRFVAKSFNGEDVVVDLATGLMWPTDFNDSGCAGGSSSAWVNALIYANGLSFAGFTDWRLPNINELFSIINHGATAPALYPEWVNFPVAADFWSSTTDKGNSLNAKYVDIGEGWAWLGEKTGTRRIICVRGGLS